MGPQEELELIRTAAGGVLRPEAVVEFARDESTALHSWFTWDDTEAARQYRIWQARELIRVQVTVMPRDERVVRAYVSLQSDRSTAGGGYRTIADVMQDPALRERLVAQALRELERFEATYKDLEELAEVFAALKRTKVRAA